MTKKIKNRIIINQNFVIISILVLTQIINSISIFNINRQYEKDKLYSFVNEMERISYKSPVIDITKDSVYFPEIKLSTKLDSITRNILYRVGETDLSFSMSNVIGRQNGIDDANCDSMVRISEHETPLENEIYVGKLTNNIKFKYIFKHYGSCGIYTNGSIPDNLIPAINNLISY